MWSNQEEQHHPQEPIELNALDSNIEAPASNEPSNAVEAANTPGPLPILKLISSGASFLVAGINDGSLGALIPYMITTYHISTSKVSLIYFTTFLGWLVCAVTNTHLTKLFPLGTLLAIGASIQILPHALRVWNPPFFLFAITFFISGLGQAYQD